MMAKHLALALVLIVCAVPLRGAQQPASPAPAGDLVYLDVSVVDAAGQPIGDLAASDFDVAAVGQAVQVLDVIERTARAGAFRPGAAGEPVRGLLSPAQVARDVLRNDDVIDRHVVIVLDDILRSGDDDGSDNWMATDGLELARAFVDHLGPDDRGAVFFTFMGRRQALTSDRARLRAAIAGFTRRQVLPADCQASESVDGCVVDTLLQVAEALPTAPARRTAVVVLSDRARLPAITLPADGAAAMTPPHRTLQALQAAHAVVYRISPAGGSGGGIGSAVSLAEATGGRELVDSTIESTVATILGDLDAHYLLALRPAQQDGRFRHLTVRVGRDGASTRTRTGVFAPGGVRPPAPAGATTPLELALVSPHEVTDVPMGATVAVFAQPGRREALVSIATAVTSASPAGASAWQAEVAATGFDPQWRPRASHRQTIEVTAPPEAGPQMVDVISALELLPGPYEIRVAADSGGRAGSVFVDVDVPEFLIAPLSASGAVVTTAPQPYAASPLLAAVLPVTPTTRRIFLRDESAEVYLRFYQGGRGRVRNLPVTLRIADASGTGIIQGTEVIPTSQFDGDRTTEWRFSLPLSRLEPGEFLLTVDAELDDVIVTRHVRFSVLR